MARKREFSGASFYGSVVTSANLPPCYGNVEIGKLTLFGFSIESKQTQAGSTREPVEEPAPRKAKGKLTFTLA